MHHTPVKIMRLYIQNISLKFSLRMESSSFINTSKQFLCKFFQLNIQLSFCSQTESTRGAEL